MDFGQFKDLGERIDREYRRFNYDEAVFTKIAVEALASTELPEFDFRSLVRFIRHTSVQQDPGHDFSDFPVFLHSQPEFQIQLLVWNMRTTAIHQHAFAGAFAVLSGSSIHTRYTFEQLNRISPLLFDGEAHFENIELLRRGDVREIIAGRKGHFHALFHLEQPSVTLVVRTLKAHETSPQLSLARPHFAYAPLELAADIVVRTLQRLANTIMEAQHSELRSFLTEFVANLDFPRIFYLFYQDAHRLLPQPEDQEKLIVTIESHYKGLGYKLADALTTNRTEQRLTKARQHTQDPELRFFLAVLLNAPCRAAIYSIVKQRHPEIPPDACCAAWLARLGNPRTVIEGMVGGGPQKRVPTFIEGLTAALPFSEDVASDVLRALLLPNKQETGVDAGQGSANNPEVRKACEMIRAIPELSPLFVA